METGQQNNDKQQNAVSINNPDESLSAPKSVKKSAEKKAKSDRPKKAAKQAEAIKPKAAAKKPTPKKVSSVATKAKVLKKAAKPVKKTAATKIIFQLKFHTKPGQLLFVTGDHPILGNENIANALPLQYLNEETWAASVDIDAASVP
ncbi:carbohydrate-binding module family 20 domain-containing protein, partial [Parafilimonas sp.]|uniref:carbohydrate-binding module family 20 domain-containing protein n=1 Tax=Parafilimonas sp. TaxID=1969739 RepID=UPI003F7D84F5